MRQDKKPRARRSPRKQVRLKVARSKAALPESVDDYIAGFPRAVQRRLRQLRTIIRQAAPDAEETISYRIPSYKLHGTLIYFAAFSEHLSVYPAPRGVAEFREALSSYGGGKGTLQLPLDRPLPLGLIRRIVRYRVRCNVERAGAKGRRGAR